MQETIYDTQLATLQSELKAELMKETPRAKIVTNLAKQVHQLKEYIRKL